MEKVKVLITQRYNDNHILEVGDTYLNALELANFDYEIAELNKTYLVDDYDGLVVTGGADVDPKYYHEEKDELTIPMEKEIEELDFALIDLFYQAKKPILGICRGEQILNVYLGGTLYQDLNKAKINEVLDFHNQAKRNLDKNSFAHEVNFVKGTKLYEIYGERYFVNTFHHQAVKDIAQNVTINSRSDDGLIEGFELDDLILAIQWHPERLQFDSKHQKLFKEFYKMCKKEIA